jgi:hypothetical protein
VNLSRCGVYGGEVTSWVNRDPRELVENPGIMAQTPQDFQERNIYLHK